jgi:hypothetical protein
MKLFFRSPTVVALVLLLGIAPFGAHCVSDSGNGPGADKVDAGASDVGLSEAAPPQADADNAVVPPGDPKCLEAGSDPATNKCLIHPAFGVFVSASIKGIDPTKKGGPENPYATLAEANANIKGRKHIFVCGETYNEVLNLTNGVNVWGNLDCKKDVKVWAINSLLRARFEPPVSQFSATDKNLVAARATGIKDATSVYNVDILAPNAVSPGQGSIGLIATDSAGLRFVQAVIRAGNGAGGADGVDPQALVEGPTAKGASGVNAGYAVGGVSGGPIKFKVFVDAIGYAPIPAAAAVAAPGGKSTCGGNPGGDGGKSEHLEFRDKMADDPDYDCGQFARGITTCYHYASLLDFNTGGIGYTKGQPETGTVQTARGGAPGRCTVSSSVCLGNSNVVVRQRATKGDDGKTGQIGANPALPWSLGGDGSLSVASGSAGKDGEPGQGGGGGSAIAPFFAETTPAGKALYRSAFTGGGGGAGGCAGKAGTVGGGGGASVAAIVVNGAVAFDDTQLIAALAGKGGKGTFGSAPTIGAMGGIGGHGEPAGGVMADEFFPETDGAPGGRGGYAGWSGHGASGPSIGILWSKLQPKYNPMTTTIKIGEPAAGQAELKASSDGRAIPMMPLGQATPVVEWK